MLFHKLCYFENSFKVITSYEDYEKQRNTRLFYMLLFKNLRSDATIVLRKVYFYTSH